MRHISAFRSFSGFIIALRNIPEKFRKKSSGNVIIYQYCYCIIIMFFKYNYFLCFIFSIICIPRSTEVFIQVFMCSNIPASPAYGVYISQLIRYARASSNYSDFLKRHLHLRNRLLDQGYKKIRLIRSLKKFIFRYQYLVEIYSVSAEIIISNAFSYSENV